MSITGSEFQTFNGLPMPRDPQALVDRSAAADRAQRDRASRASRSRSRTAGSSSPRRRDLDARRDASAFYVFGTRRRPVPRRRRRAAHGRRVLRAPRCAPRRRRQGRGRVHPLPVPRLALRRRHAASASRSRTATWSTSRRQAQGPRRIPRIERNQMIWAWHHGERGDRRSTTCPRSPSSFDPDWLPYEIVEFDVATCCQEMAENNVDFAHFMYVHGTDAIPDDEFVVDGTYKRTVGAGRQLRARGLRARARRAARQGLHDVPLVDDADRRRRT